ncbi:MAG: nucleotidyltransferase family protein [Alphaproteobacteria bacterium]
MQNEDDVLALIGADDWMMEVLAAVAGIGLPDGWIGAGFVRRKVWDHLHGFVRATPLDDIDILYFRPADLSLEGERAIDERLWAVLPDLPWSAKNQARMHLRNDDRPYGGTIDAMRFWLETPTCVAVRLDESGALELAAPYGLDDLLSMTVRPTPAGRRRSQAYHARLESKDWLKYWPNCRVVWP